MGRCGHRETRPQAQTLLAAPPTAVKLGVFTDDKNTPGIIATFLLAQGWPPSAQAWVLENLEGRDERVSALALQDLTSRSFGPLNVLLVQRSHPARPADLHAFALPDDENDYNGSLCPSTRTAS